MTLGDLVFMLAMAAVAGFAEGFFRRMGYHVRKWWRGRSRRCVDVDEFGIPHFDISAPMPTCQPPREYRTVNEKRQELGLDPIEPTEIPPPGMKVRR